MFRCRRCPLILSWLLAILACSSGGGGGSTGGVPGLEGSTCNDLCVDYLDSRGSFESLPDWPRFVFSASGSEGFLPEGDDANPCTEAEPCKSADLMEELLNEHGNIVVLDHDRWGGDDELADFDGFLLGNTGCGSGAPVMEDVPCAFLVPLRPDRVHLSRPTFDCSGADHIDGNPVPFMTIGGSGSGYFGRAGIAIERCPQNPGRNGGTRSEYVTWLANVPGVGGGQGHLVDVNVRTVAATGSHVHAVRVATPGASFVGIGTSGTMRDHADFDSNCAGATCADRDPVPQPLCTPGVAEEPYDCCDGGSPAQCVGRSHFYETASPGFTVLSKRDHEILGTQLPASGAGHACFVSDCQRGGCDNALVGIRCVPPASVSIPGSPAFSACFSNLFPEDGGGLTAWWAGLTCLPWPTAATKTYGFRAVSNSDSPGFDDVATVHLFQNTVTGAEAAVQLRGQFPGDTAHVVGRSNLFDELENTGGDAFVVSVGGNAGTVVLDFDASNVYDTDDGTAFACRNAAYDLASEVPRDDCNPGGSDDTDVNDAFFGSTFGGAEGPLESGGVGVDGDVLAGDASCRSGAICENASTTTLTIPLHPNAFVPSAVTAAGVVIDTIVRGTHHTNVGAR